jgi:L-asparaginase
MTKKDKTARDKIALILAGGQIIQKCVSNEQATAIDEEELLKHFQPEIKEKFYVVGWSYQPVSHYTLRMCGDLVQLAGAQIEAGAAGVVVTCGTQAMTEVAYFADLIWTYPQPLIFTSSICFAGTPGSETALHISQSVRAAESQACWGQGALVCVQDQLYAASEISQLSNYGRFGHSSFSCGPVAVFAGPNDDFVYFRSVRRGKIMDIDTSPARNVEILDASLGGGDVLLNALLDGRASELDGLVLSAFGDGDVPPSWAPLLRKIVRAETPVALASRCPIGCVRPGIDFEGSAGRLLEMGLINAGTLTPLQARIRLAVGLGCGLKDQELRAYMLDGQCR